ncbi:putative auxin-responsive protein IAA29 [Dichanthelium oligosanthes]|uniref:Auxin-responsive protein n=1 Tax=Dichanthelium oligosanthes TaxID=888268 RepID=A0A1E5VFG4_9POAL|nr:putative auxin-responsive protein IAA29 [Dichanthelium oligosanthes]
MDGIRSMDTSIEPDVEVRPELSPSRFVKVFMQGGVVGRKINLATHQNYASLSFTLKRLGNNYSMPSCELNGLVNNEDDGVLDDNNFILFYDNMDGDRFFLGEVPWEVFIISVKRIYILPVPQEEQENVADNEEEEDDRENGDDNAATSAPPPDGDDIPANDEEVADEGDAMASTPADGASEE